MQKKKVGSSILSRFKPFILKSLPKTGGSWWRGLTECGPLEKGMANHFSILALRTPRMKRQNDRILKEELPKSVGAQHATGDQWRNNSRKNEGM